MFVYNVLMYIAIFYIRSLEKKFMEKMFSFFNTRNIWLVSYFTGYICICYCWTWKYYDDVRKLFEEKYESLKSEIIKKVRVICNFLYLQHIIIVVETLLPWFCLFHYCHTLTANTSTHPSTSGLFPINVAR